MSATFSDVPQSVKNVLDFYSLQKNNGVVQISGLSLFEPFYYTSTHAVRLAENYLSSIKTEMTADQLEEAGINKHF